MIKDPLPILRRMVVAITVSWIAPQAVSGPAPTNDPVRIVELRGNVELLPYGALTWVLTQTNQPLFPRDRLRTRANSSVGLLLSDRSVLRFAAESEMEILPENSDGQGLQLLQGVLSFFHRDRPGRIRVIAGGALAGVEGTEFVMAASAATNSARTTLSVIDGLVRFENAGAALRLTNGQQAVALPGLPPRQTAGFNAKNLLQWCFYYPAVLDLADLPWTDAEKHDLAASLAAYRAGNLPRALQQYPPNRSPRTDAERVYLASLLLSMGQVDPAESNLQALVAKSPGDRPQRLATALRTLMAAVKRQARPPPLAGALPSEWLAQSYYEQSIGGPNALARALDAAKQAAAQSPDFGFAWERMAELEFSFGRANLAQADLKHALQLSPQNAQARALNGFLLAARNETRAAIASFNDALALDDVLANAWLGRGLCRIRTGNLQGGREDLLIAAAMEPQRAALRSYLGKAFGDAGDDHRASHELDIAKRLDPNDPTAWLYSALLNEDNYRFNEAVRDLEKSQELNDNRSVYRSSLLLDQDRAVRSANLARIYDEAGLADVAPHEAARAESADYANYSAHLFLANSYDQLLAASPFDLRYQTPAFNEYLLASLLGPADGQMLAQPVSQQEYTRLLDRDTVGFSSGSQYLSRGAFDQYAAQYGTLKNSSYAVESAYAWDPGQTPNGSQETLQFSAKLKQMLTPDDGLFFQIIDFHQDTGDISQHYDPNQADLTYKTRERQDPSILVGLDHRWSDTQRTLFLTGIFKDSLSVTDSFGPTHLLANLFGNTPPYEFKPFNVADQFEDRLLIESFELQHIATFSQVQFVGGLRFQDGTYHLSNDQSFLRANLLATSSSDSFLFPFPPATLASQSFEVNSLRLTPYLYGYWHLTPQLALIGGLEYDYQTLPANELFAPLSDQEKTQRQLSPKAAFIWTPDSQTTFRAAYSQSLGGANLDQSLRLEPTQLAGFTQTYGNLMPESLVGGIGGARFETADVALERRFGFGTYLTLAAELLHSTASQSEGTLARQAFTGGGYLTQETQQLAYQERSLDFSVHQLLGNWFSVGARYRLTGAHLNSSFPQINPALRSGTSAEFGGTLNLLNLDASFQHPSGVFARAEGQWWGQHLSDQLAGLPGDSFWQVNLEAGYRSPRRHFEISVGLLNATGQDYRLHPINLYPDLPRARTLALTVRFNF